MMAKRVNCEDDSHKEGWSYCGKRECESCGIGGMEEKSVHIMAIGDAAFMAGWEVVKSSMDKGDNVPTNPSLWAQAKSKAKSKFKVYPSAYANGWASKWYKSKGGGWKKKGKKGD